MLGCRDTRCAQTSTGFRTGSNKRGLATHLHAHEALGLGVPRTIHLEHQFCGVIFRLTGTATPSGAFLREGAVRCSCSAMSDARADGRPRRGCTPCVAAVALAVIQLRLKASRLVNRESRSAEAHEAIGAHAIRAVGAPFTRTLTNIQTVIAHVVVGERVPAVGSPAVLPPGEEGGAAGGRWRWIPWWLGGLWRQRYWRSRRRQ